MGLYLDRPESLEKALGVESATGWDNTEIKAAKEFRNAFVDQTEIIGNGGDIFYVVRGTTGIVLVNATGTTADVEIEVIMADGTYTDQITGEEFTVADGKITGQIGSTGIVAIYNIEADPEDPQ